MIPEAAPLEIEVAGRSQQIVAGSELLIPIRLVRREGAGGPVTVVLAGLSGDARLDAPELAFAAGETEKSFRITARPEAAVSLQNVWFVAKSKVSWRPPSADPAVDRAQTPAKELDLEAVSSPVVIQIQSRS